METFRLPSASPKEVRWAYHKFGAFSSTNQTQGGLAVILTLRFFSVAMRDQVTAMLSFLAKHGGTEREVDLGLLTQRMRRGFMEKDVIFVEAKSHHEFERKDVQRMEEFARQFPGATIIFATLNSELSNREKRLLTPVAMRDRRLRRKGKPFTPIVILTGNELYSNDDPRMSWRKLGPQYSHLSNYYGNDREIVFLADATQEIYLGLPAWGQLNSSKPQSSQGKRGQGEKGTNEGASFTKPAGQEH